MIADDIAAALPELQAQAESLMVDEALITRTGTEWTVDPITGRDVPPGTVEVYAGKAKVQSWQPYEQTPDVGGQTLTRQRYYVHVPVSAGPFEIGDLIEITAATNQPSTLGRKFRVAGLHEKTWQTAQRLIVDEGEVTA